MTDAPPPALCANGCGFFGSAQTRNLCSKCFKDYQTKKNALIQSKIAAAARLTTTNNIAQVPAASRLDSAAAAANNTLSTRRRCKACNKKVGLLGFNCRCGDYFCGSHRYAEEHGCSFDLKAIARQLLSKQNPLCKADKLDSRI